MSYRLNLRVKITNMDDSIYTNMILKNKQIEIFKMFRRKGKVVKTIKVLKY